MDKLLPHLNLSLEDIEGEIWKDIEGYDGYYQISSFGRLKSLSRYICNGRILKKEKILKQSINKNGYYAITFNIENKRYGYLVHRLIAKQFLINLKNRDIVIHKNSDKLDNTMTNLKWSTSHYVNKKNFNNPNKTSKYNGVCYDKSLKKWIAYYGVNSKSKKLGIYKTEEEAYKVRCEYEKNNNIEDKYL